MLNVDVMRHIGSFLDLPNYYSACAAHRDFYSQYIARKKRFQWSAARTKLHDMKQGWCAHKDCCRQRLYCIALEPVSKQVLSVYCGECTLKYKKLSSTILLL